MSSEIQKILEKIENGTDDLAADAAELTQDHVPEIVQIIESLEFALRYLPDPAIRRRLRAARELREYLRARNQETEWVRVSRAAELAGVTRTTIYRWIRAGRLPAIESVGGVVLVRLAALQQG